MTLFLLPKVVFYCAIEWAFKKNSQLLRLTSLVWKKWQNSLICPSNITHNLLYPHILQHLKMSSIGFLLESNLLIITWFRLRLRKLI